MDDRIKYIQTYLATHKSLVGIITIGCVVIVGIALMAYGSRYERTNSIRVIRDTDAQVVSTANSIESPVIADSGDVTSLVVDVEGGIRSPGVYRLPLGSVVADAIKAAGGFTATADRERIAREMNQADLLGNNSKIYIFMTKDRDVVVVNAPPSSSTVSRFSQSSEGLINLNTADVAELDILPGIGPALAQRIIDWRDEHNGFAIVEDITKVKGIGDSIFQNIKDLVVVE